MANSLSEHPINGNPTMAKTSTKNRSPKGRLKARLAKQRRGYGNVRTAGADDGTHNEDGDSTDPGTDPSDDVDLDDTGDDGGEGDDTEAEGYDEGAPETSPEDEEDTDLDAFSLDDLEDEADGDDEGDDAEAGDVNIQHDEDTGELNITHEGGDEDEGDSDEEDEGGDAEASTEVSAWVEKNIVASMLTAHLRGTEMSTRQAAVTALNEENAKSAAEVVGSLTNREFKRLARLLEPVFEAGTNALAEVQQAQKRMAGLVRAAKAAGDEDEANRIEQDFKRAIQADLANAEYDFDAPEWLLVKAEALMDEEDDEYLSSMTEEDDESPENAEPETDEGDDEEEVNEVDSAVQAGSVDVTASSNAILANVTTQLVVGRRSKRAAILLLGGADEDRVKAVRTIAKLVRTGKADLATAMVGDLRKAGYNVDPDVKPTQVDPSQPVTPGAPNRMMGPPPDAGFSYGGAGMSEEDARECCNVLGCGPEVLAWVASVPRGDDGALDPNGKFACYAEAPGDGATSEMGLEECKAYLSKRASTIHAMYIPDLDALREARVAAADVAMDLWNQDTPEAYWSVIIAGTPVGVIALADQDNPEVIAQVFNSAQYANGIRQAVAEVADGPLAALQQVRFRPFAVSYNETEAVVQAQQQVLAQAEQVVADSVVKNVGDTIDLMLLAHAEQNRNIGNTANPLKWALYEAVRQAGVANPAQVVEAALTTEVKAGVDAEGNDVFEDVASVYFKGLLARAEEFKKLHPDALAQIAANIMQQPVQVTAAPTPIDATQTLRERLAAASVPVTALPQGAESARPTTGTDIGIDRNALRAGLRLGRNRN